MIGKQDTLTNKNTTMNAYQLITIAAFIIQILNGSVLIYATHNNIKRYYKYSLIITLLVVSTDILITILRS